MKKNILWMLAAILTCGLTVTMMTSCSNDDDPVNPDPVITEALTGEWFAVVNRVDYDKDADENDIEYILLSFDENGVVTQNIYTGNTTEPLRYWERMHRHGIYIRQGYRSGTFLPQVADEVNWTKEEFLGHCSQDKAGLGWDGWRDAELYVYEAIVF